MDINRAFGDGWDNNSNNVVDEHWNTADPLANEAAVGEIQRLAARAPATTVDFDADGNGTPNDPARDTLARFQFAKQLYVLALLTCGDNTPTAQLGPDMDGDGVPPFNAGNIVVDPEDLYLLAQWCVNVVDFRDPDSINSPFEFDLNPFNGWNVDGFIGTPDDGHRDRAIEIGRAHV